MNIQQITNKKGQISKEPIVIIIGFIILFLMLYQYLVRSDMLIAFKGHDFCVRHGFDSVTYSGTYSKAYGKVECSSCYKNDCKYKEFKVHKKFGILFEDKQ